MSVDELVFLPLGGSGEIGMNMNLYGFGPAASRQWIMIDCGVTFADYRTPGIDVITPDPSYILEQKENLLALFLTHGHEDHIGAVAHLAVDLGCPVYATPFTAQLVEGKLKEADIDIDFRVIKMGARVEVGPFDLEYVTLTHSIPEPSAIAIRTRLGNILHTGDWKLDPSPTLGPVANEDALAAFGREGVKAIICDSTNILSPGESGSEQGVKDNLTELIGAQTGRVFVATFASNVSRVVSICRAAAAADRSVCLMGRSMLRIVAAAQAVDLLPADIGFVDPREAGFIPREHVLYLCTGSQGEPRAALARIARDDHPDVTLNDGDTVIFSSKIIPGNEREIFDLQNSLVELGARVITEKDADIHVSGHPNQDEVRRMYEWAQAEYAVPVHGEARHLKFHAEFARTLGVKDAYPPRNGDLIRLAPGQLEVIDEVPAGRLLLDGSRLIPDGAAPVRERRKLSYAGIISLALAIDAAGHLADDVVVHAIGIPELGGGDVTDRLADVAEAAFATLPKGRRNQEDSVEAAIRRSVRAFLLDNWGKRPIVTLSIMWV